MSIFNPSTDPPTKSESSPEIDHALEIVFDMYGGDPGEMVSVTDLNDAILVTVPRRHDDRDKELSRDQAMSFREHIGFKGNVSASESGKSWCIWRASDGSGYVNTITIPAPTSA